MRIMSPPSKACYAGCFVILLCSPMLVMSFSPTTIAPRVPSVLKRRSRLGGCALRMVPVTEDDLTKEELRSRLKEVRDHYRETNEKSQETLCLELVRTRFPELRLNRCFVAESTILNAGKGLFASRDIEEGELITLYPGDALLAWETTVGDFVGGLGIMFGNHVREKDRRADRLTTVRAREYELKIGDRHSIVADPLLVDDAAYLGHIANDAAMLTSTDKESVDIYVKTSGEGHNAAYVVMEESHYVMVATKNIAKGKEIFSSYGHGYWFSRAHQKAEPGTGTDIDSSPFSAGANSESKRVTRKEIKRSKKRTGTKKGFGQK